MMLKQILNLDGAQELGKKEQKSISGGLVRCKTYEDCEVVRPCPVDDPTGIKIVRDCIHGTCSVMKRIVIC